MNLIEIDHFIPLSSGVCSHCAHYLVDDDPPRRCKAFPEGIPLDIWDGEDPHLEPRAGDNGVTFKRRQIDL